MRLVKLPASHSSVNGVAFVILLITFTYCISRTAVSFVAIGYLLVSFSEIIGCSDKYHFVAVVVPDLSMQSMKQLFDLLITIPPDRMLIAGKNQANLFCYNNRMGGELAGELNHNSKEDFYFF